MKYKIYRKKLTVKLKVIGTLRPTDSPIRIFMISRSCFLCFLGWVCPTPSPFNKKTKTKTCLHDDEKNNHIAIYPCPLPGIRQNSKVTSIRKLKARTYTLMIMKFYSCCHRLDGFYWSMLTTSDMYFRSGSRTYRKQG